MGGRLLAQAGLLGLLLAEGRVTHTFLQLTLSDFSTAVYTDFTAVYTDFIAVQYTAVHNTCIQVKSKVIYTDFCN